MICYNHKDKQAVVLCKNCYKGLCEECAREEENGFSCSEKCHQEIVDTNAITNRAKVAYGLKKQSGLIPTGLIIFYGAGVVFLLWGVYDLLRGGRTWLLTFSMGFLFTAIGIATNINMKKVRKE